MSNASALYCRSNTLAWAANHRPKRRYQTSASASPLEETENVRSLVNLASLVRKADAKNQDGKVRRTPTRLDTRSWADEAKSRALGKDASASSNMMVDPALEKLMHEPKVSLSTPQSSYTLGSPLHPRCLSR